MAPRFIWNASNTQDGNLVIQNSISDNLGLVDTNGNVIARGRSVGVSQGGEFNVSFGQPGSNYKDVRVVDFNNNKVLSNPITDGAKNHEGDTGGGEGPNVPQSSFEGEFTPVTFQPIDTPKIRSPQIPVVDFEKVDPLEATRRTGDFNRDIIGANFGRGRDIVADNLAFGKDQLTDINQFNQDQRTSILNQAVPQQGRIIDTALANAESFLQGRLPDTVEDRAFELSARNRAAEQASLTGGGVGSPFGQSLSNLLSIQQRLNLQNLGASQGSNFLAQAAQLRFADPQRLQFNPQEIFAASEILNRSSTITPGEVIQTEVGQNQFGANLDQQRNIQQASFDSATSQFNANAKISVGKFNATQALAADQFNSTGAFNAAVTTANFDLQNQILAFNAATAQANAEREALADANTEGIATSNAANQADANDISSILGGLGNLGGIIGGLLPDGPSESGSGLSQNEQEQVDFNAGATAANDAVSGITEPIPGVTILKDAGTSSAPPPVVTAPAGSQTGATITGGQSTSDSGFSLDKSSGDFVHNNDFDIGLSSNDSQAFQKAALNVTPVQARVALTDSTGLNTRQLQAHRDARTNTPRLVPSSELSSSQVTFPDGKTGLNNNRPISEASSIRSPVPIAAIGNKIGTAASFAKDVKKTIGQFDAPSIMQNPLSGSLEDVNARLSSRAIKADAVARPINNKNTLYGSLGTGVLETLLDNELTNPSPVIFPEDEQGKTNTSPIIAMNFIVETLQGARRAT